MLAMTAVQQFWATNAALSALIPPTSVFLDIANDNVSMPYCVLNQQGSSYEWQTDGKAVSRTRFRMRIYAPDLPTVSTITDAAIAAFKWQDVSSIGFGCRLESVAPRQEEAGAYSCAINWLLFEFG